MVELPEYLGKAVRDEVAKEIKRADEVVDLKPEDKPGTSRKRGSAGAKEE